MKKTSRIPDFHKLELDDRLKKVKEFSGLSDKEIKKLKESAGSNLSEADKMIENVIGTQNIPIGIATNFQINNKDYLIPMSTEEPSVVAAASKAAKLARKKEGFTTKSSDPKMIGQIQIKNVKNSKKTIKKIEKKKDSLLKTANSTSSLTKWGGGAEKIETREINYEDSKDVIIHLIVDTRDSMGANSVNTMVEKISAEIEKITGEETLLKIISNLSDKRISKAHVLFDKNEIGGKKVVDNIVKAQKFAERDIYRAVTHNKGIMNGISAIALATGNDTRAIESGAHGYASKINERGYQPLTSWSKNEDGDLVGEIEIPTPVGIIGGSTEANPISKICLKILSVDSGQELGEIMAAVGLAQNFAALRALVTKGIQKGHMKLHKRKKENPT